MTKVSPGAYAAQPEALPTSSSVYAERMTMDISMLKKQYRKLRERQQQAHIILTCEYLILYFISTSTKIRRSIMLRHYSLADLQRKFSGASPYGTKFFHFHTHFHRKAPMSEVHAPPPTPSKMGPGSPPTGNPRSAPAITQSSIYSLGIEKACKDLEANHPTGLRETNGHSLAK